RADLRKLPEEAGHEGCAEARDGAEAIELAESEAPELAILDVKMPRLDGIEAARRILEERPIPIVMLTAYGQDELVARAVEAGGVGGPVDAPRPAPPPAAARLSARARGGGAGLFAPLVRPSREPPPLRALAPGKARHAELEALREEAESLA